MERDIAFVAMAAGVGRRYGGRKQLQTFGRDNLTIAEYNVRHAMEAGFSRFYFIVDDSLAEEFHGRLTKLLPRDLPFYLIYQRREEQLAKFFRREKPWGTAHALMCCAGSIGCNFCSTNADDLYGYDALCKMAEFLGAADPNGTEFANVAYGLAETLSDGGPVSRGIISAAGGLLKSIEEMHGIRRESVGNGVAADSIASMNLWGFTARVFDLLRDGWEDFKGNSSALDVDEFGLPNFINGAVKSGKCRVRILNTASRWVGITHKSDDAAVESAVR